jgi:serine/threonine protein kinase
MGDIYVATDLQSNQRVAFKTLSEKSSRLRFEQEAQLLSRLNHPSIVRYVAHGIADNTPYLVMEWVTGDNLAEYLQKEKLTVKQVQALALQTAQGLGYGHSLGIVHRDIKPANLLVLGDGDELRVKILDFGVARDTRGRLALTSPGARVGTPGYMAPEQTRGDGVIDSRADTFALGCVLFECIAGYPAFMGTPLSIAGKLMFDQKPLLTEIIDGVPPAFAQLIFRMLAKRPDDRPGDQDLIAILSHTSLSNPQSETKESISLQELPFVSMVVGGRLDAVDDDEEVDSVPYPQERVTLDASPFGAHLEWTPQGGLIALVSGADGPKEQALRAARCALAIRKQLPQIPLALVAGRAGANSRLPVGDLIDRAVALLESSRQELPQDEFLEGIHVDVLTAALLEDRCVFRGDKNSIRLMEEALGVPFGSESVLLGKTFEFCRAK